MPEPDLEFVKGPAAARAVAQDPFWSTVVRRHGDMDVVVLPAEDTSDPVVPPDEPVVDATHAREDLRARLGELGLALGLPADSAHRDDVWFAGAAPGTLRWQGTVSYDDLDAVTASAALERAQEVLQPGGGRHPFVPEDGAPRVPAGRRGRWVGGEVQVLLASASRVVVRLRSDLVHVGRTAAARALDGEP